MSTHLHQPHRQLPNPHISTIQINNSPSSDETISIISPTISQLSKEPELKKKTQNHVEKTGTDDDSCRTPTTKESKIPEIVSCPPAPRKPKALVSCKRKLMDEFKFFEDTNKEDMEAFFRSTFPKRNCPCTLMNN
ncbi:hypothetical protein TanjilG_01676 [Lupinus angustifolius]|uniref:cyclin-dependent protein kinase inhibitor SMR2-like n=1 Tax=Lupinus angustifolius TaxID=3871 RepID=UPI00090DD029|nr:PREDICTED: cyclin-dependent protein kinase inhibitor SMR2-like [Lupinus angustifolius]OIV90595.1 hypothetical protein TanjilG_01676 [Lupinus angustifolius]